MGNIYVTLLLETPWGNPIFTSVGGTRSFSSLLTAVPIIALVEAGAFNGSGFFITLGRYQTLLFRYKI